MAVMRVIDRICDLLAILAGVYLIGIMLGIVVSATARTLLISGPWSSHVFTFTEFGLLYIVMAASPWLVRLKGHVFIELLSAALPTGVQRPFSRIVAVLCVVICFVLAWFSLVATMKAYDFGDALMRSLDMPKWLVLGSMPIGFGLMGLQFLRFVFGPETLHTGEAGVHE